MGPSRSAVLRPLVAASASATAASLARDLSELPVAVISPASRKQGHLVLWLGLQVALGVAGGGLLVVSLDPTVRTTGSTLRRCCPEPHAPITGIGAR